MSLDEDKLRKAFAALQARVDYLERALGLFASDEDLDGHHGDPRVKFSPSGWRGENCVGKAFSECSPDFLEVLGDALAWSADHPKAGKEQFASYNRADAKRARGWARRIRNGWRPSAPAKGHAAGQITRPVVERPRSGGARPGMAIEQEDADDYEFLNWDEIPEGR